MQIALTFDDGPHRTNTPRLLDLAAAHDAHLTFFAVGNRVEPLRQIVARQVAEGHQVGNHSWSHRNFGALDDAAVRHEISATQGAISACGATATAFRPPYGVITPRQRSLIESEFALSVDLWTVDSRDWQVRDADEIRETLLAHAQRDAVVLAHDIHSATIDAMAVVLPELSACGFKFVTLAELKQR